MDFLFMGEDEYAVDDRGRMLVPPSYKAALTELVVMGRGGLGQLWVYPEPTFKRLMDEMQQVPLEDRDAEYDKAMRAMLGGKTIEFDKQGRLSIPPFFRKLADIADSVIVLGNGDRVELWSPERYAAEYGDVGGIVEGEGRQQELAPHGLPALSGVRLMAHIPVLLHEVVEGLALSARTERPGNRSGSSTARWAAPATQKRC